MAVRSMDDVRRLLSQGGEYVPGKGVIPARWQGEAAAEAVPPSQSPQISGLEPSALEAILYGKDIPLFVGGKMAIGGRIIEGPFFGGTQADPTVSFIASHALCANPSGTRAITRYNLRGKEVWNSTAGPLETYINVTFKTGTETQLPFASSISRYGEAACGYRPHILSEITDLPLKKYGGIIPFPTVYVEDTTFGAADEGMLYNEIVGVLLNYMRFSDDEFFIDVPGRALASIVGSSTDLMSFIQSLRGIYVNWSVSFRDKIYITDPDLFTIVAEITRNNHVSESMEIIKGDPLLIPREKKYTFIDVDRDYEPNVASARMEIFPIPTTSSVQSENIELPFVQNMDEATAAVNIALFQEQVMNASQVSVALDGSLFGIESGDVFRFADHSVIDYTGRVQETAHDFENWTVSFRGAEVLNCGAEFAPIPDCAVIHLDFEGPQYLIDGVSYDYSEIIVPPVPGGTNGLNGGFKQAIGDLFDRWSGLVEGAGLTTVVTFRTLDNLDSALIYISDSFAQTQTNSHKWLNLFLYRQEPSDILLVRAKTNDGEDVTNVTAPELAAHDIVPETVVRVAFNFIKGGAGVGRVTMSVNGGAALNDTDAVTTAFTVAIINIGNAAIDEDIGPVISTISICPLQTDAALPGLSAL